MQAPPETATRQRRGMKMQHKKQTPSVSDLKDQARRLRQALSDQGTLITHSKSLELLAQQYGARDWNTLRSKAEAHVTETLPRVGDRLHGQYMGQSFSGVLKALQKHGNKGALRVSIQLDQPVDVVSFDSFSSWRHRITGTVNQNGVSFRKRSDGTPHLVVEWAHG